MTNIEHPRPECVWMSESGIVVCALHAFPGLARAIAERPDYPIILTPYDSWMRVYASDAAWYGATCLKCDVDAAQEASGAPRTTGSCSLTISSAYATHQTPPMSGITQQ